MTKTRVPIQSKLRLVFKVEDGVLHGSSIKNSGCKSTLAKDTYIMILVICCVWNRTPAQNEAAQVLVTLAR